MLASTHRIAAEFHYRRDREPTGMPHYSVEQPGHDDTPTDADVIKRSHYSLAHHAQVPAPPMPRCILTSVSGQAGR
jgi:hypothetical protein